MELDAKQQVLLAIYAEYQNDIPCIGAIKMKNELLLIKDIVAEIKENADDSLKNKEDNELERGRLLAYNEVLSLIKVVVGDEKLKEIGLDFDIDSKYI